MTNESENKRRSSFEGMGRRLDDEVEKLISYLNDEVVPQMRDHSSRALRIAADRLARFADYMDENRSGKAGGTAAHSDMPGSEPSTPGAMPSENAQKDGSGI